MRCCLPCLLLQQRLVGLPACFLQMDITQSWPLVQRFDWIVANLVLEHVADLGHLFAEARRVLRGNGRFYIHTRRRDQRFLVRRLQLRQLLQ